MSEAGAYRPAPAAPAVPPRHYDMTVVAQDPTITGTDGRVLTAKVRVPADWLEPGPRTHRFHVVDYDAGTGELRPPADLGQGWDYRDRFETVQDLSDPAFHAQNVLAVASRTLATCEAALGRRLSWGFGDHHLYLVPRAFAEANAYYTEEHQALLFGYLPVPAGEPVYTSLAHDIIAHETSHAVLDGLRRRFNEPGLPDQAAFHEAFADVVALLSVFSIPAVVTRLLGEADDRGRIDAGQVSERALRESALFALAEQLGAATSAQRGSALRRSVGLEASPSWRDNPAFEEPHRRGEVLVAAVMQTVAKMWRERLHPLIGGGGLDRDRAAEEGARAAGHLLRMVIRAIDYCPPVEFEFEDFLTAVLVSDAEVAPDDEHGYRGALREAFRAFGIVPTERCMALDTKPVASQNINFEALRGSRDEMFRFVWENADALRVDGSRYLRVENVRPSTRVAPDGMLIQELIADYVQMLNLTAAELPALGIEVPERLGRETELQLLGGGTVIFDQFGGAKYHHAKPLEDAGRQTRRLAYLVRRGLQDTRGRYGFALGLPSGQRFAALHVSNPRAGEDW